MSGILSLADLLNHLSPIQYHGPQAQNIPVESVAADSRAVGQNTLFVAIRGERFDGHQFVGDALRQGAVAIVGTVALGDLDVIMPAEIAYVQVARSRLALATCSAALQGFPSHEMTVIGVTGTDGKTTTVSILEAILAAATRSQHSTEGRVGVITTVGARIGGRIGGRISPTGLHVTTPDAPEVQRLLAEMRDAGSLYAVVESTSHGLDQERVAAVDFNVAAVTNITHEHLDYHGSHTAYVNAKARLFEMLFAPASDPNALRCAVLNRDDEVSYSALRRLLIENGSGTSTPVVTYTYGVNLFLTPAADVVATDIVHRSDRTRFRVRWWEGEFDLESFLIGDFNVANILCAATVALALGVPPRAIQAGITSLAGVDGRMERIDRGQSFLALVDFAHSPASLERALLTLRDLADGGRLIAVFGSAGLRDREKRRLMGAVSGRLADYTIVTAEDPRTEDLDAINREIVAGLQNHAGADRYCVISDREAAIQHAVDMAQSGDVVAAFGKGHERSICFGETEFPWHEQAVMAQALERRMARL